MKIVKYDLNLNRNGHPVLIGESRVKCKLESITSPDDAAKAFSFLKDKAEERAYILSINKKGKALGMSEISHGTSTASMVGKKEVITRLLLMGAHEFILAHNHPSGDSTPSIEDMKCTKIFEEIGKIMDIPMVDHVIIGKNYYSFRNAGLIRN